MSDKDQLLEDAGRLFSKGLVEQLKSRGHDFIEEGREGAFIIDSDGARYIDCYTSGATYNLGRALKALALGGRLRQLDINPLVYAGNRWVVLDAKLLLDNP